MVLPVDNIAFQIVSVVGLTLPIFILAVDAFKPESKGSRDSENDGESGHENTEHPFSKELVSTAMGLLIFAALLSLVALLAPPKGEGDLFKPFFGNTAKVVLFHDHTVLDVIRWFKNLLVDMSTILLAFGYLGLWYSIRDILSLDMSPWYVVDNGSTLQWVAVLAVLVVVLLNFPM